MIHLGWLKHEVNLQIKNGLYGIYIVVNLIYLFLLGYVPEEFKEISLSLIIFSDPTVLGMVFIGAFILLEKINGVTGGIAISPLGAANYIKGKLFSMMLISLITSLVLAIGVKGWDFNIGGLVVTVAMSSMIFTLLGILLAVYTKTINQYLMGIIGIGLVTSLPLVSYFGLAALPSFINIIPTYSVFLLIERSIAGDKLLDFPNIILLGWLLGLYWVCVLKVDSKLFRG